MTRINLVPPRELADQHLFAEWREIKMIPRSLQRSLVARGLQGVRGMVPKEFTLNKGHVSFFYDKGLFLHERYRDLTYELNCRNVQVSEVSDLDPYDVFTQNPCLLGSYIPTPEALVLIRERIASRIALKPFWYRYTAPAVRPVN